MGGGWLRRVGLDLLSCRFLLLEGLRVLVGLGVGWVAAAIFAGCLGLLEEGVHD